VSNGDHIDDPWSELSEASFVIGGEDQIAHTRARHSQRPSEEDGQRRLTEDWRQCLADLHIRVGTLLKADTVSFLLGAGASKEAGGPLIGEVPLELERRLINDGIAGAERPVVRQWIKCFYVAAARACSSAANVPVTREQILARRKTLANAPQPLPVNYENLLSQLHRWRAALPREGGRLRLDAAPGVALTSATIDECLRRATAGLAQLCQLPTAGSPATAFEAYKDVLRKILTRPLNLKRASIFTLNYDTLVERAADAEGVVLIDGFVGTVRRVFRPESYDHDLYFPAETTEGRVHRLDRVIHLLKLHGSITWVSEECELDNPYGIRAYGDVPQSNSPLVIYPTPAKWGESLGMPYAELLRRFSTTIVRPQCVLFVVGYGFGDDHICAIVRQALAIPSFTLVIVDPKPESEFVRHLRDRKDPRVWIFSGTTFGTFTGFVRRALPDLRDETIRREIMETHRALAGGDETNA
jgi:hypothetical protein